jgi:NAD(P)-dependent dehydrogenase (short-subunit alcohol dehydrogenase family)
MPKLILITGSSRGIGRETALLAAERGWTVAVNYVANKAKADEVVALIEGRGGKAAAFRADVAKHAEVVAMFAEIDRRLGRIDVLVNNAGVGYTQGRLDATKPEDMVATFEVNVFGLFYCLQEGVKRMSTKHGGTGGVIVNVSSGAARNGGPGAYIDYAGSKAAVDVITTGLAKEVGGEGIRVNGVRPGFTETEMMELTRKEDPEFLANAIRAMPMGRMGTAREIAQCILWLASDDASYVTGTIIDAAGGRTTA